jgi:hypothetical protein
MAGAAFQALAILPSSRCMHACRAESRDRVLRIR